MNADNLALLYVKRRQPLVAKVHLEQALAECPSHHVARRGRLFRLSWHVHAYLGNWERAFADLERAYRLTWQYEATGPRDEMALWRGEQLTTPLVVIAEARTTDGFGGLGDILLFSRYLRSLAERAGRVVLALRPTALRALAHLLRRLDYLELTDHHHLPSGAAWLPLELTPVYGAAEPVPYLPQAPAGGSARFTVAMAWAGAVRDRLQEYRTVPVSAWAQVLAVPGMTFVSVQQRRAVPRCWGEVGLPVESGIPPVGVEDRGPALRRLSATAATLGRVDLVISSDTAVAHLAGALGRPLWILLSTESAPYWELAGERTRWYPTARLFRQRRLGDWGPVMAQVAAELESIGAGSRRQAECASL